MNEKKRAVAYARVSTEKDEQKTSIASQKIYYPNYIKEKGMIFVKLYYDEGLSATSSNRKDFINMLYDAGLNATRGDGNIVTFEPSATREPLFDWIVTKDHDRFARNIDAISIVRALRVKEVYIEFENLGFTTESVDWEFRLSLFLTFAQQESLDKSRKLKDAFLKKSKRGKFHMSVNLLGYNRDKETKEYYIVEEEAEPVRKIFDYYTNNNIGSSQIGDLLNEQGYTTKQGKRWNKNSVARVLKNEKYKGQVILNRYGKTDITYTNKRVINPKDEWIIHDDAIPKIVSIEQFDKAQKIMNSRTKITRKSKDSTKRQVRGKMIIKNIFYEKIICGKCGSDYIRETTIKTRKGEKIKQYYYGCRNRRNNQRNKEKCINRGISHDVLVRELLKIGERMNLIDLDAYTLVKEQIALEEKLNEIDELIDSSEHQKGKIDEEVKEIDKQIGNLFSTLAGGVSDNIKKLTHKQIEKLERKQKEIEATKADFEIIELNNKKRMYVDKFDKIVEISKKDSYTFDEIIERIHEIEIMNESKVLIKFYVPTLQEEEKRLVYFMFSR